jgi:anti-sigma-K factor RskA
MRDWSGEPEGDAPENAGSGDEALALQALLYASGELEEAEAAAFEERLAADQTARDALCQAVQLTETLAGNTEIRPDPSYRARVRRRLRQRLRFRRTLAGTLRLAGSPALWSFIAVGVAILMLVLFVLVIAFHEAANPGAPPTDLRGPTDKDDVSVAPAPTAGFGVDQGPLRHVAGER